jgi:hypothetical protein
VEHRESIDDRTRCVKSGEFLKTAGVLESPEHGHGTFVQTLWTFTDGTDLLRKANIEGLSDLLWLADSAALNNYGVELCELRQAHEFF